MPRKKEPPKQPIDMTTEELAQRVFPPNVLEKLKELAAQEPKQPRKPSSQKDSN